MANSDFELKLVTSWSLGIAKGPITFPFESILSRKIGDVTPKLASGPSLFQTLCESSRLGYSPLSIAAPHVTATLFEPPAISGTVISPATHPGGSVCPAETVLASPE